MVDEKKIDALFDWMCDGARPAADGRKIVAQICEKLNAAGVPVDLYRLFVFTIHPLIKGRRLQWTAKTGTIINEASFSLFETGEYHDNPLPHVIKTQQPLRRRLVDPDCPHDYKVVGELIAEGFTDYLVQPVIYIDGEVNTMSWSTKHREGFSDSAIAALERIRPPLARLIESYILRLNAAFIISTYVGRGAGHKVLSGHIKRGDAEEISAVILFADFKNYTQLSNELPAGDVLERLNRFFDALEEPIGANGGEILKFMGDGLLAIFPVDERESGSAAKVAAGARDALASAHARLAETGGADEFRAALHVGRLFYGNMGAASRLDFTAIGPAVNLTARLLGAASALGHDDVCSAEMARLLDRGEQAAIGNVELKGFKEKVPVFAVA
jgi:adenylate cyclase